MKTFVAVLFVLAAFLAYRHWTQLDEDAAATRPAVQAADIDRNEPAVPDQSQPYRAPIAAMDTVRNSLSANRPAPRDE